MKQQYTWKIGFEFGSRRTLDTNRAVPENAILTDLYDGQQYRVQAIYPAKPEDKDSFLPDVVLHTFRAGVLSEEELRDLRRKAGYKPSQYCGPLGNMVF